MSESSLTVQEAAERAALIQVTRYDIEVDLRGLLDGETMRSVATVTFTCARPGSATLVDCAADVARATLNGVDLDLGTVADGRIPLPGLGADNVLVVEATQSDTASGRGVLRTVDPTDDLVYVWTSLEPDEARRLWACFDQPDLKAPHAFTVHAPESWTVLSNRPPAGATAAADGDGRTWTFPDTPPLSTYVVVVNAGPFHELREQRGGHDLGLWCRQSIRPVLERNAADLFTVTEQGLAFFADRFGSPFPQERYDQVFVPNLGGAMENWGCVTHGDGILPRSEPSHNDREWVALFVLHEMAHMWFGDLVTMRWWDDLWLNEAFASWAATWALAEATEFTDAWASFLIQEKLVAYDEDMTPASHPIRTEVPDVAHAMANFDGITYYKGQSVLRQLFEYVGEPAFTRGLQAYFARHAWGNTVLADLIDAVAEASGRDLEGWTEAWLDRAGTDVLTLADGTLTATTPDGLPPRPHRLDVGCFSREGDALRRTSSVGVEVAGAQTPVALPAAALYLVNDGDLTFASARADAASTELLLASAGDLPDALARAVAVGTAWDLLVRGEVPARAAADCLLGALEREDSAGVVEPFLDRARHLVERWLPAGDLPAVNERLADIAADVAGRPGMQDVGLRTLAACAVRPDHFDRVETATDDPDLAWRLLARRAELGEDTTAAVDELLARDPDPEARFRALAVQASAPDEEAKAAVWQVLLVDRAVPSGWAVKEVSGRFWRPGQTDLLLPWAHRWFDEIAALPPGGMLATMSLVRASYPPIGDDAVLERAQAAASAEVPATVRSMLVMGADRLARMMRARS